MSIKNKPKIKFSELWQQVDFTKTSTITLIFSNLLVIFFAIVDDISANDVLWIYWSQSVIIGIFNFIKMITLKNFSTEGFKQGSKQMLPTRATAISSAVFFLFHYGFFHVIYAVFLGAFSTFSHSTSTGSGTTFLFISAGMFFISYLIEFVNFRKEETDELPNIGQIMFAPYARIIPMHLTIILGGFIGVAGTIFSANTNLSIIVLFTSIKTVVDLITHSVDFKSLIKQKVTVSD
ncbi:MAG: hypothetical protein IT276_15670 [Ignavibacteriaceae bacterium]|nr:hypothetical protein [Ignavibacterium sp.]MCC6256352.1 hypothetical protein [Ignavibacteriaceae bacterium]HMN24733.1 DUF6498-containing protein [Ignavibacteriaceae bacterium]HRN27834.1 DUF6498-containing protein [Ignavibacteriaceae bacterium]HRP91844.1 DUF6498-containing protein [Ignavibacteriaceae bacterium]